MKPFYNTPERIAALRFAAKEMLGTPFSAHAMIPGVAVDCVHVNGYGYLQSKLLTAQEYILPEYALDSGSHSKESQLLKWLNHHPKFHRMELATFNVVLPPLMCGDTICFNLGLSEHHVALMLDEKHFEHVLCSVHRRVIVSSLDESYYRRHVTAVYRPIELEVPDVR
ncbi:MAG: hypothetical protein ABSF60_14705 [Verrucomicrobiota bacterium]